MFMAKLILILPVLALKKIFILEFIKASENGSKMH